MKQQNLIILVVAAVLVVVAVIAIPALTDDGSEASSAPPADQQQAAGDAPPISEDAEMPSDHPDIGDQEAQMTDLVASAEEAYEANPEDVPTVLTLADAYLQAGRFEESREKFNEALELDEGSVEAQSGLAMVSLSEGDNEEALSDLEDLGEANPESQVVWYNLGVARFSSDDRDGALNAWQQVVDIDADSDFGQMAAQFVSMMQSTESGGGSPHGSGATDTTEAAGN